jgi:hypothetical protein
VETVWHLRGLKKEEKTSGKGDNAKRDKDADGDRFGGKCVCLPVYYREKKPYGSDELHFFGQMFSIAPAHKTESTANLKRAPVSR